MYLAFQCIYLSKIVLHETFQQSTTIFLRSETRERVVENANCVFLKSSTRVLTSSQISVFGPSKRQFGFYGVRKRGSNSFHCIITQGRHIKRLGHFFILCNTVAQSVLFDDACRTTLFCYTDVYLIFISWHSPNWYRNAALHGLHSNLAASFILPWQKLERRHGRRALPPTTTGYPHIIVPRRQVFGRHVFIERDGSRAF